MALHPVRTSQTGKGFALARAITGRISFSLSCLIAVTDRYGLAREFELAKFEMTVMKITDLYQVQEIAIKLFSQTLAQRRVYEELLREVNRLPPA